MATAAVMFDWSELAAVTGGAWQVAPPRDGGVCDIRTDSRASLPGALFVALPGERFDGHDFADAAVANGAAAVCVARLPASGAPARSRQAGVPVLHVPDTLAAFQQLARAHRLKRRQLTVIAVTGSCGKTSVKEMIGAILRRHAPGEVLVTRGNTNNFIGVPQNLLRLTDEHRFAVLELGTNAPGEIAVLTGLTRPDVAVLTCVAPVHLERLGSIDGVTREKAAIFAGLAGRDGLGVVPAACCRHPAVASLLPPHTLCFGTEPEAHVRVRYLGGDLAGSRVRLQTPGEAPAMVAWHLAGAHQALNAGAAAAAATGLGIPLTTVLRALGDCHLPGMRMEVTHRGGVCWINDAYNANPASVRALVDWLAACGEFGGPRSLLVLGDMLELGRDAASLHRDTLRYAATALPRCRLWAVGEAMTAAAAGTSIQTFADATGAAAALPPALCPGDVVALKGSRGMRLEGMLPAAETADRETDG